MECLIDKQRQVLCALAVINVFVRSTLPGKSYPKRPQSNISQYEFLLADGNDYNKHKIFHAFYMEDADTGNIPLLWL